jgi:type I restriction-modification system DNA methylase subunit
MGRKERARANGREQALELVRSGKELSAEEIAFVKRSYSGIGGLCPSNDWAYGAFFTPPSVVKFVHDLVGIEKNPGTVLELACGAGGFFEGIDQGLCTGIEVNRDSYSVAKACYPGVALINAATEEVFPFDRPSEFEGSFDYVLGNPPFGTTINWASEITGGKHRKLASEVVFMDIAFRAVRPGGKIAMVVPDGLLNSNRTQPARDFLGKHCLIKAVISLPTETFYHAGTSVKTSVLYLEKLPSGITQADIGDYSIFMAVAEDVGWDSRGRETGKSDFGAILHEWIQFAAKGAAEEFGGEILLRQQSSNVQPPPVEVPIPPFPASAASNQEEIDYKPFTQLALFG